MTSSEEKKYLHGLKAVSPIDGRAALLRKNLNDFFSEGALHRQRAKIQLLNLQSLSQREDFPYLRKLTPDEHQLIKQLIDGLSEKDSEIIAKIDHFGFEGRKPLEHDVKASEYYVRHLLTETSLEDCLEFAYFPFTSEDVSNIAYNGMLTDSINKIWLPSIINICDWLKVNASQYCDHPVLALTHGQPASPTTMGKRFGEFLNRLTDSLEALQQVILNAKCSGPVGNHNAINALCPEFDYLDYARSFVMSVGFEFEPISHQRNPHLRIVRMFHLISEVNHTLLDFAENIWQYILQGWMEQVPDQAHVGSSVMPQKVNPWRFESAQGYAEISNSLIHGAGAGLLQSKFERDLSDHPWERIYGEMIGYSAVSANTLIKGLKNLRVNSKKALQDVENHPEVLSEAIQIAGRLLGLDDPYDQIKSLIRGKKEISLDDMHHIIQEIIPDGPLKQKLLALTPKSYTGIAANFARLAVERYDTFLKSATDAS